MRHPGDSTMPDDVVDSVSDSNNVKALVADVISQTPLT